MGTEPTRQARIRRLQDTLAISGVGTIAFGAWSLAKIALVFLFLGGNTNSLLLQLASEEASRQLIEAEGDAFAFAIFAFVIFAACIDLGMRLYVGLSARAEGHGRQKGVFYLVVAGLLATSSAFSIILAALGSVEFLTLLDAVVSIAIEATSLGVLVLMISCSIRLRRMAKPEE